MVKVITISRFLSKLLRHCDIADYSRNGLQVRGRPEVRKIGFAVDACLATFQKAEKQGCDLVIVHHGLLWMGGKADKTFVKRNISYLKKKRLSLFASHLPLDMHEKYGNNIQIAKALNLDNLKRFARYGRKSIGYVGELPRKMSLRKLQVLVDNKMKSKSKIYSFGKKMVKTVGISCGGGDFALEEAIKKKIDVLLSGEFSHTRYHPAKEGNMNVVCAGHYATETWGVRALKNLLSEKYDVKTVFLDGPTGL